MDGILIIDKEKGWTSHDVCAFIRSRFKIKKVGHGGTLDPLATGLLVILLGRATRLFDSVAAADKEYGATMRLGIRTDSHDLDGRILEERDPSGITKDDVERTFQMFRGEILQTPPMISALKHKGMRLYQLARQGKTVERVQRLVTIHRLELKVFRFPEVEFFAHVSKGTYLRTLVDDMGKRLGCFATLTELRRLKCGEFDLENAVTLPALKTMDMKEMSRRVRMSSSALVV